MSEFCPTCYSTVDPDRGSAFCPNCGTPFAQDASHASPLSCAYCGRELTEGSRFCDGCRQPTGSDVVDAPLASATIALDTPAGDKNGLAGVVRTGPWLARLGAMLLVPFWATSEIRQTKWPPLGKLVAGTGVWILTLGIAAGASPAMRDQAATKTPDVTESAPTDSPSPTPAPTEVDRFADVPPGWPKPPDGAQEAFVVAVTDGDTIVLRGIDVGEVHAATGGRRMRLIGIDTPEVFGGAECYGAQASAFTKAELDQKAVLVDFDVEKTDRYGRALAYVWLRDGTLFNARLASEGYALQLTIPPNVRYAELFSSLVTAAREANRGLWAGCASEPVATAVPFQDRDCTEFSTQAEAQQFFEEQGGPGQDPHGFDADNDGIACEGLQGGPGPTAEPPPASTDHTASSNCHVSYPDFCIEPPPPDLDCGDISQRDFTVRHDVPDPDPHGFDGADNDGRGCEG